MLEMVYFWTKDLPITTVYSLTGYSKQTVVDWYNLCRDVCCSLFNKRQTIGGAGETIQIDESLLRGKRKYNRGRILLGDRRAEPNTSATSHSSDNSDSEKENQPVKNRNYGHRVEKPSDLSVYAGKMVIY